ncbi:putative 4-hydroxyphenylpyruvate dioxygenase [Hysterangium stoloniferum]|nr:putative 4-hydroxyphenylpyruvate dioxygenase [Hysterangium stoloniferum]
MQPLLGISSLSLGSCEHHSLFSKFQAAAHAGFTAVDLFDSDWEHFKREYAHAHNLPQSTIDGDPTSVAAARAINQLCTSLQLRLLCLQPFREFEARKDPKEAAERLRHAKGTVSILPILGTDMLLIPSTTLPASQLDSSPERMAADLAALSDYAASFNPPLKICYEALSWGTHVSTWRAAWDVVALANRANLGLCLDSFNTAARQWADPYSPSGTLLPLPAINAALHQNLAELVTLVPPHKIFYFQLADGQRMLIPLTLPEDPTVPPLRPWSRSYRLFPMETSRGAYLPVREFAEAVKRTGYEGPWCLEIFNDSLADPKKEVPDEHARRGIEGLRRALAAVGLSGALGDRASCDIVLLMSVLVNRSQSSQTSRLGIKGIDVE